ncbi:MAG: MobC family plasmid mobilization relaxosome protein [Defluviitaleaceae bacterium]|nr:MobC family plasmid mobilization relaxosome protein [Defluviitaleaceae bacterium]
MSKKRTRKNRIVFCLDDSEFEILSQRLQKVGMRNREAFVRKMVLDGYIINLDISPSVETNRLIRSISNNINQITKRCNETGSAYENDFRELHAEVCKLKPLIIQAQTEMIKLCKM